MRKSRAIATSVLGFGAAASLALIGAAPAGAVAGDTLYSVYFNFTSDSEANQTLTQVSPVDGSITTYGPGLGSVNEVIGVETYGAQGYGIGWNQAHTSVVFPWDVNTGTPGAFVPVTQSTLDNATLGHVFGLDTTVGSPDFVDGTLLTIGEFSFDATSQELPAPDGAANADIEQVGTPGIADWVGTLDPTTGVFTPLINISNEDFQGDYLDSLATDPTTGITYLFFDDDGSDASYVTLDFAGSTYSKATKLAGISDSLGNGYLQGADFDAAGVLWFYFHNQLLEAQEGSAPALIVGTGEPIAHTTGAFGGDAEAVAFGFAADGDPGDTETSALAVGPAPVAALAKTGFPVAQFGTLAGILLLAGAAGVFVTRRRVAE